MVSLSNTHMMEIFMYFPVSVERGPYEGSPSSSYFNILTQQVKLLECTNEMHNLHWSVKNNILLIWRHQNEAWFKNVIKTRNFPWRSSSFISAVISHMSSVNGHKI